MSSRWSLLRPTLLLGLVATDLAATPVRQIEERTRRIKRNIMDEEIEIAAATHDHLEVVVKFLQSFMDQELLLPRTSLELELLLKHAFVAMDNQTVVGFAALEIYSKKLAEIQCLAVADGYRRKGIGRELVNRCVERSRDEKILELMAISSSEELFRVCGFDYSLPSQKRAFFLQTRDDKAQ